MRYSTLWLCIALGVGAEASSPSVTIEAGTIAGGSCANSSNGVYYKSIPYAQPPVGKLRFAPPEAFNSKYDGGKLDGTKTTPACIQFQPVFPKPEQTSEDCLYLDVWAPANATKSSNLPVRVWIYGGANQGGYNADPLYDGCNVADNDALMVSINYRVGPLGYFALKDANFTGNQGIQDALLALQWVQDNIGAFGGDPKKVMLHGESAGGLDTFLLASLPQAPKLMSAAAIQSGPSFSAILQPSAEEAAATLAKGLKCSKDDASCLQNKSVDDMMSAYQKVQLPNLRKFPGAAVYNITSPGFNPSLDGSVIKTQPDGVALKVPAIIGSNTMEGNLFAFSIIQTGTAGPDSITSDDYTTFLNENFGTEAHGINESYPLSDFKSSPFPAFSAISQIITDQEFFCPARRVLDATTAAGVPAWTYLFAHKPECGWLAGVPEKAFAILGSTHTAEIPFVLGNTAQLPQPNGTCEMSDDEKKISRFMLDAWTAMGLHQRPVSDDTQWPAFDSKKSMGLNVVNSTMPGNIDYTRCKVWDDIEQRLLSNPSSGNGTASSPTPTGSPSSTASNSGGSPNGYPIRGLLVGALVFAFAALI